MRPRSSAARDNPVFETVALVRLRKMYKENFDLAGKKSESVLRIKIMNPEGAKRRRFPRCPPSFPLTAAGKGRKVEEEGAQRPRRA